MTDINPFEQAKQDVQGLATRIRHKVVDFAKTYSTAAAVKALFLYAVAAAAAALNFPIFAFVAVAVALVASAVYIVYATKLLKAQDSENRHAYVDGKRVMQDNLDAKIAMDTVTLALMGERDVSRAMRGATPELRSALAFHQHQLRLAEQRAEAAEAVKEGTATDVHRRALARSQRRSPAAPKGPAVEPIKARRAALAAERAELEAEIQSLVTADNIDAAMKAEEVQGARRTRRERQDATRKADQAARERVRAGKQPPRREPEHVVTLRVGVDGERDVSSGRGKATPEQIAKGEDAA